jgi:hypothetical protein
MSKIAKFSLKDNSLIIIDISLESVEGGFGTGFERFQQ